MLTSKDVPQGYIISEAPTDGEIVISRILDLHSQLQGTRRVLPFFCALCILLPIINFSTDLSLNLAMRSEAFFKKKKKLKPTRIEPSLGSSKRNTKVT